MKPLTRLTLAFAVLGLAACAEERPPIDRVQPNALDKTFFVGSDLLAAEDDPEFWMQGTLVDVGYGASQDGLFTSTYAQPLNRIRWQITEQHLIARVAYERIEDSDGKGAGRSVKDGVIAAMFRVQSHFDIIRSYNPTTGEKMNIVEENSSDRPWFERAYMRVDFSANLATNTYDFDTLAMLGVYGGVKYEPMSYWVSDPNDPDAPHFDTGNGYFDITTKAFATPQMIDLSMFDWGIDAFPACFLEADFLGGSYPGGTCNPAELTIRHAFRKVVDTDYEPSHWDGLRFQAYGPFTKDRFGFARNYGMSDDKWHRFISRYDIWERSHFYENAAAMTGAIPCNTDVTTPFGADPNRDIDKNGTSDECQVVGAGSRCDTFNQKCTLPFAQRKEVPIVWYYAEPGDPAYFEGSYWATHEWDVALRSAVVVARYAECQRTGGDDCAARFPVWHGQDDDNSDAIHLAREVDDCRAGRAYPELARDEAACAALADSLGADLGYSAGVIATAKMAEMVVLCHSPVEAGDPAACGDSRLPAGVKAADCRGPDDADVCKAARRVRRGDLRYHQVNVIQEPQSESPWGIYTDAEDPLSGQKISASINVWSSVTDRWSQNIIDMARFIGGELSADDVTDGTHVQDWARAAQAAGGGGALGVMGDKTHASHMAAFGEARLPAGGVPGSAGREARSKAEVRPDIAARVADVKAQLKQVKAHVKAPSSSAPTYAARLKALAGTPLESSLLTPMMQELAGVGGLPLAGSVLDGASPLRGMNPSHQRSYLNMKEQALAERGACILHEAPAPMAMVDLATLLQKKFGAFNAEDPAPVQQARAEKMRRFLATRVHMGVMIHEMGHSVGMRHNFVSSSDAFNYRPQYWQLRTRNGAVETACGSLDATGEGCVGPRYFDPVTADEQGQFLWMFMQSSVMEYPGEGTQETQGLGVYDFAAARMFYGDAVAVFSDDSFKAGTDRGDGVHAKMDNFGGILGFAPQIGDTEIHYSQLQASYDLIRDCRPVDPAKYKPSHWDEATLGAWDPVFDGRIVSVDGTPTRCATQPVDYVQWDALRAPTRAEGGAYYSGGPSLDKDRRTRVPYGFGTDDWADLGNLSVYRNDNGADAYELFNFLITQHEMMHIFDNFRRNRQDFSVRGAAFRSLWRYQEKLRDAAKGLGLIKNIYAYVAQEEGWNFDQFWPSVAPFWFPDSVLAAGIAFDHFTRLLARPQSGEHYFPNGDDVLRSVDDAWGTPTSTRVVVPNGGTGRFGNVAFGGRPLENRLAEDQGEYNASYTMNAGSYYDKTWSAMLLTESVDNFISSTRGDFLDPRYRSVSIADLFPDGYRRWLANNLTGDDWVKGPRLVAKANGMPEVDAQKAPTSPIGWTSWWRPDGPEVCFPNAKSLVCSRYGEVDSAPFDAEAPANVAVLDPQVGWEQQKFLIAWTMIYLPENEKQQWIDMLRLWETGRDDDPGFANRIEFHNPYGRAYVARTFGTEEIFGREVQKGIAARSLEYANSLLEEAFEFDLVTGPDGTRWPVARRDAVTGQPIVRFDAALAHVDADGNLSEGSRGCDADENWACTCAANRACLKLMDYVSVPAYLAQMSGQFAMWDPSWKGVY
jgi:hypothetical protein